MDLADEAARLAATNGGTHVVATSTWSTHYETFNAAVATTECTRGDATVRCEQMYTPPRVTSSGEMPEAEFVVLRVPFELWMALPYGLRPASK
jgi:hypothetical protein